MLSSSKLGDYKREEGYGYGTVGLYSFGIPLIAKRLLSPIFVGWELWRGLK